MEDLKRMVIKIDEKLDKVSEEIAEIKVVETKQAADLEHHIFRTNLAEQRIEMLHSQIQPLSKFHTQVNTVFKIIGVVGTVLGLVIGAGKIVVSLL